MQITRLFRTLKFRMLAAAASALTAIGVTSAMLRVTQRELEHRLLKRDHLDRERTAALLGSRSIGLTAPDLH